MVQIVLEDMSKSGRLRQSSYSCTNWKNISWHSLYHHISSLGLESSKNRPVTTLHTPRANDSVRPLYICTTSTFVSGLCQQRELGVVTLYVGVPAAGLEAQESSYLRV